jgi:light-regulated signal transduction histidine kinase (bacteriophytochrome)
VSNQLDQPEVGAVVATFHDIHDRKTMEEKMRRDAEALARSNAELQSFAYAAAHDLKEPMRTVCSFTQLLMAQSELDDAGKEYAGFVVEGATRMATLLDGLLALSSLKFTNPRSVKLQDGVEQAKRNLMASIRESGAIITSGELPSVLGNAAHMTQLFQNLIANAIKYRGEDAPQIDITAELGDNEWVVRVKDNGIGIAPQYHDHVFGLFKRLHTHEVAGTGMGLALCRKIIEGMGGKIWVESETGKGCTFYFTVPALMISSDSQLSSIH